MALEGFYTAIITIAIAVIASLYETIWKKSTNRIKDLDGSEGHEGTLLLGDIWMTDIKREVEEFHSFIQENIAKSESTDKFVELFTDKEKISSLKKKLDGLTLLHKSYSECKNLFAKSRNEHEILKNWVLKMIIMCFAFSIWGAAGFLVENTFLISFYQIFWGIFIFLVILIISFSYYLVNCYQECEKIDSDIRREKTKHSDALGKVI